MGTTIASKGVSTFFAKTFGWMFAALMISMVACLWFMNTPTLLHELYYKGADGKGVVTVLGWATIFAPIFFAMIMVFAFERLSKTVLILLFIIYAFIDGVSFSFILSQYTAGSLLSCFLSTAGMFGIFALYGYLTKKDLSSLYSILYMCLIGIFVSLIVNLFLQSNLLDYIISFIGVLVFSGLTAYDVQKIKEFEENDDKTAIMGAFTLYLDFVNMFLFLLRFLGVSKD
jgi:hypothetical protein